MLYSLVPMNFGLFSKIGFRSRSLSRFTFIVASKSNCHYYVLGISKEASKKEIRQAYLQKTKQFHPDNNPNDSTLHEKFIKVTNAYQVLADETLRDLYNNNTVTKTRASRRTRPHSTTATNPFGDYAEDDPYWDWDEDMKRRMYEDFYKNTYPEYLKERQREWEDRRKKNRYILLACLGICLTLGIFNFSRILNFHNDYQIHVDKITVENAAHLADKRTGYGAFIKRKKQEQQEAIEKKDL